MLGVILLAAVVAGSAFAAQQTTEGAEAGTTVTQDSSAVNPAPLEVLNWVYLGAGAAAVGLFFWRRWYRWGAGRSQLSTLSPVAGLAMGMVMLGLARLGAEAAGRLFGIDTTGADGTAMSLADSGRLQLGSYAAQGIILAAFVWLVVRGAKRSARPRRYGIPRAALIGVAALLLVWPVFNCVAIAAGLVVELLTGSAPDPIGHTLLAQLVVSPVDVWLYLTIVLAVVGAPVYEEVLYRGIVQQALVGAGMRRWPAILTTSVLFALVHLGAVPLHALPLLFVLSIGFGWVYEKTGRMWASITMHAAFNLVNLLLAWLTVGLGS